jgi:hypothetical protein
MITRALAALAIVALLVVAGASAVDEQRERSIENGSLTGDQIDQVNQTAQAAGAGLDVFQIGLYGLLAAVLIAGISRLGSV